MKKLWISLAVIVVAFAAYSVLPPPVRLIVGYWLAPDDPRWSPGQSIHVPGLRAPVELTQYRDGRWRIAAASDADLYRAHGFLQARDRMFQMDLLRHIAWGRLAELVGDVPFGSGSALTTDRFNRFIGLGSEARAIFTSMDPEQQSYMQAFADGVNAWIAADVPSLEHRLLEAKVAPWRPEDSLAIFRLMSFGLTHNYSRELRRLVIACAAGLDAAERVWPSQIEFEPYFLPPEHLDQGSYVPPPAILDEMRAALPGLCPPQAAVVETSASAADRLESLAFADWLRLGISSSNNWVVSGAATGSGGALLANDPHLPHMNPPLAWGVHLVLPDRQAVGLTLVGLPLVIFGHNFHVAWGATTNNVDLQDLYVEKPVFADGESSLDDVMSYEYDGDARRFDVRRETFRVRGGDDVVAEVRFSVHGPVLNDVDPFLRGRIPLTTLRSIPVGDAADARAVERAARSRTSAEFVDAIQSFDSACQSWVYADGDGHIGFISPCRVPIRRSWQGTFPLPGWLSAYEWDGWIPKELLPASADPERGWIATANNQPLPRDRYFTTYNNDASPPSRYERIASQLDGRRGLDIAAMARLQVDTVLPHWPHVRATFLAELCTAERNGAEAVAQRALCDWDGDLQADSVAATVFMQFQHALLDRALADDLPGGAAGELWHWLQSIPHIETNVDWLWYRPADDPVWDDVTTDGRESRGAIVALAFADAVRTGRAVYGDDVDAWAWGQVRPFQLRHPLAGASELLAGLLNSASLPGVGAPETVFKNQFVRSDRTTMHPGIGAVLRFVVDMSDPYGGGYALAGGQSGWPGSRHYADLVEPWMANELLPMSPPVSGSELHVRLVPD